MEVYLVGGAVRDRLLGISASDNDYVVVHATIDEMLKAGFEQVGNSFPVFLHPKTKEEYALARTERKNGHGYTGFICDFSPDITLEEDLVRRDLTINAIAMDEKGNYIDPCHGIDDINNKILRHVSDAFVEDPLRVLRVARFAARFAYLGFVICEDTMDLMSQISASGELECLTPERIWSEMERALKGPNPEIFFEVLHHVGALKVILPEVENLFGVPGPVRWHPEIDTFIHTIMTLHRIAFDTEDSVVRFAMLCHDLGKALTPKEVWPSHPNHAINGVKPLDEMCKRLKVPNEYHDFAKVVVTCHSDMHHLYRKGAKGIVTLFDKLDAWRRPERVKPFALCCKCDFLGRLGFEHRPFPRADYFCQMFKICQMVTAKEFVSQGYKGIEIKEAMFKRRCELVDEFLKTLPSSEITDKANSLKSHFIKEE